MKIAYICMDKGVPIFGKKGCSVHVQEVVRSFLKHGIQVDLFAARLGGDLPVGLEKVRVHSLLIPKKGIDIAEQEKLAFNKNTNLRKALEHEGPFDLVYERYSLWSFAGMEYAKENAISCLLEVNAPLIDEQLQHRGLVDKDTAMEVASRVFNAATSLIAVSGELATYLRGYSGVDRKVSVVPNGIDPGRFSRTVTPLLPASSDIFTIGFVGTLKPWHGLVTLVDAFEQIYRLNTKVRLLIVGDGPERDLIERKIDSSSFVNAVEFTGAVDPLDIPGYLASMDVAVAPYPNLKKFYFSPLKVYEYMAAGLPVIASEIGQLKELISDGYNGILIPPDNPMAMAEALHRLQIDPQLRNILGQNARRFVFNFHTWDNVVRRILDLSKVRITEKVHSLKGS